MTPGARDAIVATIDSAGVHLQFEPQPSALETCWYTVGLTGHGHPELIVFGLPPDISRPLLRDVAADLVAGRRVVTAGQVAGDVLAGHPVRFVEVPEPDRHLPVAAQFYAVAGTQVRAMQIVWPDRHDRWPWDAGSRVGDMPVLGGHS